MTNIPGISNKLASKHIVKSLRFMAVLGSENVHYKLQLKTRKSGTVLSAYMIVFEAHLRFQKD